MRLIVCAVFDKASELYGQPFFVNATGQAIRSFQDEANRQADDNTVYKHPTHFALYQIGTFDNNTGELAGTQPGPTLLADAAGLQVKDRTNA